MSFLQGVYRRLPGPVRGLAEPAKKLYILLETARAGVWILRGRERSGLEPLTVGFTGSEITKNYLARKIFADGCEETPLGRRWLTRAFGAARAASKDAALFIWEVPQAQEPWFRPEAFALLPSWVRMNISLVAHAGEKPSAKFKKARNMVARQGLTREVVRDAAAFAGFYRDYHRPYITARHEDAAMLRSDEKALKQFLETDRELLWIKRGAETLGGAVVGYDGGEAHWWQIGVRPGLTGELGRDAGDAIYFHLFSRVREKGHDLLNLGHCRPFLNDGVMEYKRNWGARLFNDRMPGGGVLALRVLSEVPALKSFLRSNPFVALGTDGRYAVSVFMDDARGAGADEAAGSYLARYGSPGAIDLRVYAASPSIRLAREIRA